jgi:hypothetical protein
VAPAAAEEMGATATASRTLAPAAWTSKPSSPYLPVVFPSPSDFSFVPRRGRRCDPTTFSSRAPAAISRSELFVHSGLASTCTSR